MTTLVISDLHLGGRNGADVLAQRRHLDVLVEALDGIDRLVLLGDVIETRHGPLREVLERARPVLEAIGETMDGREVLLAAGNHDHVLVDAWLERLARTRRPALDAEQLIAPSRASWGAAQIARWLGAQRVAYPGLWLRDDVYATHGHYLDVHAQVPTFERLGVGVTQRIAGELPDPATAADYEALLAPVYGWVDRVAEWSMGDRPAGGAGAMQSAYKALAGGRRRSVRGALIGGAFPLGIAALNRAGLGPLSADLSGPALRRSTLGAMAEVVRRLGIDAPHVIFGHSHRKGPLPGDDATEWGPLINSGCWVFESKVMAGPDPASPYWPGGAVLVNETGPPELLSLLGPLA